MKLAVEELTRHFPNIRFSSEQTSEPMGTLRPDWFLNRAAKFETEMPYEEVRAITKEIERQAGRTPDMLWMMLKVFLWSLLFVIPGIIKALSYAMTPYILHQYPNVPAMEACNISEKMMKGHKTDLFITELSFLGWILLAGLTFGILYILYVGPYMEMTMAGIYDELERLALESNIVTEAELNGEVQL